MQVNYNEVADCVEKLYYTIFNPSSKRDIPSSFYERMEKEWVIWKESNSDLYFYDFVKQKYTK